jgi:SAM-dependent methyltransferase
MRPGTPHPIVRSVLTAIRARDLPPCWAVDVTPSRRSHRVHNRSDRLHAVVCQRAARGALGTVDGMTSQPSLMDEQLAYYRAVAADYATRTLEVPGHAELIAAIDAFQPTGHVLELACGPGTWTQVLARRAQSVTAIDAAPEMLAFAQARVDHAAAHVHFIEADVFTWRPERRYDAVCFGFWISHVPEGRFATFWQLVDQALAPGGRLFFFDDNARSSGELVNGPDSPVIERCLDDGTRYRLLKIAYDPAALEHRLSQMGWNISVRPTTGPFYWATGHR